MLNAFVRKVSTYGQLSADDIQILAAVSERRHPVNGLREIICRGDEADALFILMEGWACRYRVVASGSRQITAFLMPGDIFDIQIGQYKAADHSIGTLVRCQIAQLSRQEGEDLIFASPSLTKAFWNIQLAEADIAREWLVSLGQKDSISRLAHLILELCTRMEMIGHAIGGRCELPITQSMLADALGMTSVHLNRVIKVLREDDIAEFHSKRLVIKDKARLVRIAEFSDRYLHRRTRFDGHG